jgi:hypothetical protein
MEKGLTKGQPTTRRPVVAEYVSIGLIAAQRVLTRTCPVPGLGRGTSVTRGSAPALEKVTACIVRGEVGLGSGLRA